MTLTTPITEGRGQHSDERGTSHKTMERTSVRSARRRPLLGLAALLLLLVAVAIASTGSVPAGTGGTRRPADRLLDALISLYLLLMVVGSASGLHPPRSARTPCAMAISTRTRRSPWVTFGILALGFGLLALFVRWLSIDEGMRQRLAQFGFHGANRSGKGHIGKAGELPAPVRDGPRLVVVALVAIAVVAWYLSHRARRSKLEPLPESLLPALADVLDETLDDLRAETDPRRAVIAAYARMERALAAYGLPRSPAEAPDEYLQRIFADLEVSGRAASRLTALFTWAKFSGHDVAPEMKQEAIEALEAVREELRAAEILAEEQRLAAVAAQRERAAAPDAPRLARDPARAAPDDRPRHCPALAPLPRHARGARVAPRRPRPRALAFLAAVHTAFPRTPSAFTASLRRPQVAAERPGALLRLEREASMAGTSAFDVHYRLRPTVTELAAELLSARRGIDLEQRARAGARGARRRCLGASSGPTGRSRQSVTAPASTRRPSTAS